ncbi:zinc finger, CCHC-type containing protein [Tanacetum coccineum]
MAGNTMKDMTTNFGKLDKFEGHDFRRRQKKMHFLLSTLKVVYVLTTPMPELLEDATVEAIRIRAKWENDDYICRGHILNGMSDSLFDVYTNVESAKELWDSLESKYMAEDFSSKKFLVNDLSLVQLGSHLRIEESLRAQDSDKGKGKKRSNENNSGSSSNKKPKLESWKCDKTGHFKRDCRSGKKNNVNAGGSGKGSKDQSQDQDRCWFKTLEPVEDGFVLYMGDEHFAPIHEKGSVALEFSSGKICGYKQVYESDKYILSKCGVFVRFGYYNNGMFMLNLNKVPDDSDSVYMSSSTVVNSSLWHARLGHVHYKRILEMSKDDLIPAIDENLEKCIIQETTAPYTPQQNGVAERKIELLRKWLIPSYLTQIPEPRKGKRVRKAKSYGYDFKLYLVEGSRDQVGSQYTYCYNIEEDPRTYNEAMQSRDASFWKEAIDDEIGSIMENNTWVLSNLHPGCKPLGCKWILKRKMKVDGTINKFKARLVIQGFKQKEGIDYFDT